MAKILYGSDIEKKAVDKAISLIRKYDLVGCSLIENRFRDIEAAHNLDAVFSMHDQLIGLFYGMSEAFKIAEREEDSDILWDAYNALLWAEDVE